MLKIAGFLGSLGLAILLFWLFWGPIFHALLRFAGDSGIAKLGCLFIIAYFGGLAIPFLFLLLAIFILFEIKV
jgi:cytochrome c biogenesis protein CcdA